VSEPIAMQRDSSLVRAVVHHLSRKSGVHARELGVDTDVSVVHIDLIASTEVRNTAFAARRQHQLPVSLRV
jgi:hypothetical protein